MESEHEGSRLRTFDELVALAPSDLLSEWECVGRMLLVHSKAEFLRAFHIVQHADPLARASERMPNLDNWSLVGWIVMNASDHNRRAIANTIIEVRDTLYRAITAHEIIDTIRGRA